MSGAETQRRDRETEEEGRGGEEETQHTERWRRMKIE
tara:strand:+ start:194 stop:304 length:111 start_codon:yes stop_codon:yes gene_type:complete